MINLWLVIVSLWFLMVVTHGSSMIHPRLMIIIVVNELHAG